MIQRFDDRCTEANADIQRLQAALQDTSKRLETADNRLSSTMESRNKLRKQLEAKHAEMTSMQASLQADVGVLQVLQPVLDPVTTLLRSLSLSKVLSLRWQATCLLPLVHSNKHGKTRTVLK